MPQPVAFNTGSSISGSIQSSKISYAIETSGSNYRGGYAGKTWYSELPANNGIVFIKDTTSIGRGAPGNPAFWITNGTSSASILATANGLPGSPRNFTTTSSAYSWSLANGFFINDPNEPFNQVDTDSLVLYLDASKTVSYPTTASTWYDISGNNDSGSLLNGITSNNSALIFDGIDDNVNIESYISMSNPTTVCMLINRSLAVTSNQVFFGPQANGQDNWLSVNSNVIQLLGTQTADINNFSILGTTFISSSRWYFVTGMINGPSASIYLNGNLEFTNTQSFNIGGWGGPARIGSRGTTQFPFPGQISTVQVYNKALSQAEILQNYYQAPIVTNGLVFAADASNLVSYESGSTLTYSLTGSNSGSLINGTGYLASYGGAWDLDGTNDYINIPYSGSTSGSFTFNIIMKCDTMNADNLNRQTLFGLSQNGNQAYRQFDIEVWGNSGIGFRGNGGPTEGVDFFSYSWTLGVNANNANIYTVAITPTGQKIYVNGQLKDTINQAYTASFNSITLGVRGGGGSYWNGQCYHFSMYNRELSSQEVAQNFNAQRNRFGI